MKAQLQITKNGIVIHNGVYEMNDAGGFEGLLHRLDRAPCAR